MLEASVGVKLPEVNPARIISGVIRDRMEPKNCLLSAIISKGCRSNLYFTAKIKTRTIRATPMRRPGSTPPINSFATLTLAVAPYIISGILGGNIGPITEEAAVTAPEKSSRYPFLVIASISMVPRPPASAAALPDMPAKMILATILA